VKAATHVALAGLTGVVAAGFGVEVGVVGGVALAAGALLPDVDTTTSGLGRWVKPFSGFIERKFGHRTITHSLLGLLILAVVTSWVIFISANFWTWLLVGALTHIILDAHNISGVPLLYPMRIEFVSVYDRGLRVPYASANEFTYLAAFAVAAIALMPLSMDGFAPWFHRALGAPYGAIEDYLEWRDTNEVWVDIEGYNLMTDEDVKGRYRVIDSLSRKTLLVEDGSGRAYTAALNAADIQIRRVRAWRGEELVASTYRLDLSGRLVSDLIYSLPKGAKAVRINAILELNDFAKSVPAVGYFQRVEIYGKKLKARSATIGDLAPLANYVIESGSAVIRAEYAPGSEALADLTVVSSIAAVKSHRLSIPNLPSLSGLVIDVGDELEEGQLVARYVDDSKLEISAAELEAAKAKISELEQNISNEREIHELKKTGLQASLVEANANVERLRYLVERNAEPRNSLIKAELELRNTKQAVLMEETGWTSKLTRLEQDLRAARLSIQKTEQQQAQILEKQWVRAPVAGVVSDIRVAGVGVKGVNLEVMILEQGETVGPGEGVGGSLVAERGGG